jgi:hypothetical protein
MNVVPGMGNWFSLFACRGQGIDRMTVSKYKICKSQRVARGRGEVFITGRFETCIIYYQNIYLQISHFKPKLFPIRLIFTNGVSPIPSRILDIILLVLTFLKHGNKVYT